MKKIIVTGAALLAFAATTYAQIVQSGKQQYANQIRNGQSQTGTITQDQGPRAEGSGNFGNYAITIQGVASNTGPANADINQNNGSQGNRAGITQNEGTSVSATISQNGGPDGLSGGGLSASATIGSTGGEGNFAGIAQQGKTLEAVISQNNNSRRNGAEIYQNGSQHRATISQSNGAFDNDAFILQGYTDQNVTGAAITNAYAQINQGRVRASDTNTGMIVPESVASTARIIQNESFTLAQIDQGTLGENNGTTNTSGRSDGSQAVVEQRTGSRNSAVIIQQGVRSGESVGSRATVIQTGAYNTAAVGQGGATAYGLTTIPGGSDLGSVANIIQYGSGDSDNPSRAFVRQGTAGGASLENVADVNQETGIRNGLAQIDQGSGTGAFSANNAASIMQASKATSVGQLDGTIGAFIYQNVVDRNEPGGSSTGRLNTASIRQTANVTDVFAYIEQGRSRNGAVIMASRNEVGIYQFSGSLHRAGIQQGVDVYLDASGRVITPTDVLGTPIAGGSTSNNNSGSITQFAGTGHSAKLIQNGRFNLANIQQVNPETVANDATIFQVEGASRGYAEIGQISGTANSATVLQFAGSDGDNSGFGNYASIQQEGGSNNVAFIQQGQARAAGNVSSSNDNYFRLVQAGSGNQVRFLQQGNGNYAQITQNGDRNELRAAGGGVGSVASQVGANNRLVLTQNGGADSGLIFYNTQIGNNLTAIQIQNPN